MLDVLWNSGTLILADLQNHWQSRSTQRQPQTDAGCTWPTCLTLDGQAHRERALHRQPMPPSVHLILHSLSDLVDASKDQSCTGANQTRTGRAELPRNWKAKPKTRKGGAECMHAIREATENLQQVTATLSPLPACSRLWILRRAKGLDLWAKFQHRRWCDNGKEIELGQILSMIGNPCTALTEELLVLMEEDTHLFEENSGFSLLRATCHKGPKFICASEEARVPNCGNWSSNRRFVDPEPSLEGLLSAERSVFFLGGGPNWLLWRGLMWSQNRLSSIYIYIYRERDRERDRDRDRDRTEEDPRTEKGVGCLKRGFHQSTCHKKRLVWHLGCFGLSKGMSEVSVREPKDAQSDWENSFHYRWCAISWLLCH